MKDLFGYEIINNKNQMDVFSNIMDYFAVNKIKRHRECSNKCFVETNNPNDLTPVEFKDNIWIKRDDTFVYGGSRGGKVRTALALCHKASKGVTTAGSRKSPQVNIVAQIAAIMNIKCRVHVPSGEMTPELIDAKDAGAEIFQHKFGYNNVIIRRAIDDAQETGYDYIPFGMQCEEAVYQTARQIQNIPTGCKRIVVPVGSGMTLSGILWGLYCIGKNDVKVIGVVVGASPIKRLYIYAPPRWKDKVQLINAGVDYHKEINDIYIGDVLLDPVYEAKCKPFINDGDLFWIIGKRKTAL